jgi:pyruvate kinase
VKELIAKHGIDVDVVAKIERPEAVHDLEEILGVSDAVMVARGDMGVELGPEAVPVIQKRIIHMAIGARKPVITATQMLESMVTNPRPTRAEVSDVANAIYDGSSALMMSAETASGKYPVRAARIMARIVRRTEADMFSDWEFTRRRRRGAKGLGVTMATVRAAAYGAVLVDARLVAVFTESGRTAQLLGAEQISTPIFAFTPFQRTVQRLSLTWGVSPIRLRRTRSVTSMVHEAEEILVRDGVLKPDDTYVVIVGTSRQTGVANIMKMRTVGAAE